MILWCLWQRSLVINQYFFIFFELTLFFHNDAADLASLVGGNEYVHVLLTPLEILMAAEDSAVRDSVRLCNIYYIYVFYNFLPIKGIGNSGEVVEQLQNFGIQETFYFILYKTCDKRMVCYYFI